MATEVPVDLITEILKLLPAETLLRFRCLSKSLGGFIDSPNFINWHLHDNITRQKIVIRDVTQRKIDPLPIHVIDIGVPFLPKENPDEHVNKLNQFSSRFCGHCNGLVIVEEDRRSFVVWNPTTRKTRNLPVLSISRVEPGKYAGSRIRIFGFGYDSSIDDYKFLLIIERFGTGSFFDYETWILGFNSGYWRRIDLPNDGHLFDDKTGFMNCFLDGAFHFLWYCGHDPVILAFDVAKETFSRVSLPAYEDYVNYDEQYYLNLQVVQGCLCVGHTLIPDCEQQFSLYSRKKNNDGGDFFWTKLFSIDSSQKLSRTLLSRSSLAHVSGSHIIFGGEILGFSKDGDKMYVLNCEYDVYSYDFKDKYFERILAGEVHARKVFSCIESLVSVNKVLPLYN